MEKTTCSGRQYLAGEVQALFDLLVPVPLESCPHPDLDIFGLKAKFQSQSSQFLNRSLLASFQSPLASRIGEKARAAGSLTGAQRSVKRELAPNRNKGHVCICACHVLPFIGSS